MPFTVKVKNFQSIGDAELEVRGLTVITGQNNFGKTALMRAVFGLFSNAKGHDFVRHGSERSFVSVDFGDGNTASWEKGIKHGSEYKVNGVDYKKVGQGTPDWLSGLGVVPVNAAKQVIWPQFAHQMSGQVFLLDQPGSVLAEAVADVERVGVLNEALRLCQSDRRSASSELKVRQSDLDGFLIKEKGFANVDSMLSDLDALTALYNKGQQLNDKHKKVSVVRDRLISAKENVSILSPVRALGFPDSYIYPDLVDKMVFARESKVSISNLKNTISRCNGIKELPHPGTVPTMPDVVHIADTKKRIQETTEMINKIKTAITKLRVDLLAAEKEIETTSAMIKVCPTCGTSTVGAL